MPDKDMRERPWKKLRIVVEVTVPPTSRATEKDLLYVVESQLGSTVKLRRPVHDNAYEAALRIKTFTKFWPWFLKKERGISISKKKKKDKTHDPFHGL